MDSDEDDYMLYGTPIEREEEIASRRKKSITEASGHLRNSFLGKESTRAGLPWLGTSDMAEGTRSQEAKRMEESIRLLRENQEYHAEALEGLKELITGMNMKYDQLASKILGSNNEYAEASQNDRSMPRSSYGIGQARFG